MFLSPRVSDSSIPLVSAICAPQKDFAVPLESLATLLCFCAESLFREPRATPCRATEPHSNCAAMDDEKTEKRKVSASPPLWALVAHWIDVRKIHTEL